MNDSEPFIIESISGEEIEVCLNRLLTSQAFKKSPVLRQLLSYVVHKAAAGLSHEIKEHVIGIDVFGRRQDFDGRIDNIVRVQAHRLRKLLTSYYADEGKDDLIQFSVPKGSYVPKVERLARGHSKTDEQSDILANNGLRPVTPDSGAAINVGHSYGVERPLQRRLFSLLGAFALGAFCVSLTDYALSHRTGSATNNRSSRMLTNSVLTLWKPFLQGRAPTIVSFVNPVFVRGQAPGSGMFPYNGRVDVPLGTRVDLAGSLDAKPETTQAQQPMFLNDTWTGTGEVLSVNKLSSLFAEAGRTLNVKRSRTLSAQDIRGANVIFVGYSSNDPILQNVTKMVTPFSCCRGSAILNNDSKAGDPSKYGLIRDQSSNQLVGSHALFSVLPGIASGTKVLVAAGLSTHGTWAAVDYLTSEAGTAALIHMLQARGKSLPDYFQAVIRTEIVKGEAANCSLIAAREVCLSNAASRSSPNALVSSKLPNGLPIN